MMTVYKKPEWYFYLGWVLLTTLGIATAWGLTWIIIKQVVGIVGGTVMIDGRTRITEDWLSGYVFIPLLGLAIGLFQYLLLRRYLPRMGWWIAATALGWPLAALFVTILRFFLPDSTDGNANWLAFLILFFVGGSVGFMQWLVLRPHLPRAGWWILATIVGWMTVRLVTGKTLVGLMDLLYLGILPAIATSLALWLLLAPPRSQPDG